MVTSRRSLAEYPPGSNDLLGNCIKWIIIFLAVTPYLMIFSVSSSVDPCSIFVREILNMIFVEQSTKTMIFHLLFPVRLLATIAAIIEANRATSYLVLVCIIPLQIIMKISSDLEKLKFGLVFERSGSRLRNIFSGLYLAIDLCSSFQGPTTAAAMALGQWLFVLMTVAVVKMHHILPPPLLVAAINVVVLIPAIILVLMPKAANVYEASAALLRSWVFVVETDYAKTRSKDRLARKLFVKALRPYKLYASIGQAKIFMAKRSTKSTYFASLLDWSVNGIVSLRL